MFRVGELLGNWTERRSPSGLWELKSCSFGLVSIPTRMFVNLFMFFLIISYEPKQCNITWMLLNIITDNMGHMGWIETATLIPLSAWMSHTPFHHFWVSYAGWFEILYFFRNIVLQNRRKFCFFALCGANFPYVFLCLLCIECLGNWNYVPIGTYFFFVYRLWNFRCPNDHR